MSEVTSSQNVNSSNNVTGGVDYDSGPYTVTFPAGVTSVSFHVPIINDGVLDIDETLTLTIADGNSLPDRVTRGDPGQAKVTISDDDGKWYVHAPILNVYE